MTRGESPSGSECQFCDGTGFELASLLAGHGAKRCRCKAEKERATALALVPPRFGSPRLDTLAARSDLHPKQAQIISGIRANPNESYLFYGLNGVGKSHLGWALYCHAIAEGRRAVAAKLDALLTEYRKFELQRSDDPENHWRPCILSEDLKSKDRRWTIFLDELEKSTPTEFAAKRLFALLDAAQEYGHQLLFTSNLTPEKLQHRWSREDEVWGNSIARRIAQVCTIVDLS